MEPLTIEMIQDLYNRMKNENAFDNYKRWNEVTYNTILETLARYNMTIDDFLKCLETIKL